MTENEETEDVEAFLAGRREAGLRIDPENCEVTWHWSGVLDPYGVLDLKEDNTDRGYFARSDTSDGWVSFYDLPESTAKALWAKHYEPPFRGRPRDEP